MARYLRNTVILAKLESTYGTDATPTGASDAMLISNVSINPLVAQNVNRDIVRGFFGGSEQLVGTAYVEASFDIELAGSGTPTTPTQWGRLLQACGMAQTVQAASVDYTPISVFGASSSLTIYYYLDGQLHKLLGARGTFSLNMRIGERPTLRFRFIGLYGGLTAASNATPTLTGFRTPLVITNPNTGQLKLGAVSYVSSTGNITPGTAYTSRGLTLDIGNNLVYQPLLGVETVEITQREATGNISLDLSAAQAVTFMADVLANTTTALGITHGGASGNTIVVHSPVVQLIEPSVDDVNGQALHAYNLRLVPSAGNDELRIVTR